MTDRPWLGPQVSTASYELTRVGWYCPGGHEPAHLGERRSELARPSVRLDDPCEHGVPVYALLSPQQQAQAAERGHGGR